MGQNKNRYKKVCAECNINYKSKGWGSKYCSKKCRQLSRAKERKYINCSNCNTQVRYFPNSDHKGKKNIYCSNKCQGEWMLQHSKELELAKRAKHMFKSWNEDAWKKGLETRKKNGNIITEHDWKQYKKRCDYLTRKIRKQMLQGWDGYDYIDGEYIKENLNLHYTHKNYPTLDHIVPRSECFKQGLSPDEATTPTNLKWTKRINNSKKNNIYGKTP